MATSATSLSERHSDQDIQRDVLAELKWDVRVSPSEIGVVVKDGVVSLRGTVDAFVKRWAAEDAALSVRGVKAVANDIEVKLGTGAQRSDDDIAAAAARALEWDAAVPKDRIKVKVSDALVTLIGEVEWHHQKVDAERVLRRLTGVKGVSNLITVEPVVSPSDLRLEIESALVRSAKTDAQNIQVDVQGGKVLLTGKVKSAAERYEAERVAWLAPGVTAVDNQIVIFSG